MVILQKSLCAVFCCQCGGVGWSGWRNANTDHESCRVSVESASTSALCKHGPEPERAVERLTRQSLTAKPARRVARATRTDPRRRCVLRLPEPPVLSSRGSGLCGRGLQDLISQVSQLIASCIVLRAVRTSLTRCRIVFGPGALCRS